MSKCFQFNHDRCTLLSKVLVPFLQIVLQNQVKFDMNFEHHVRTACVFDQVIFLGGFLAYLMVVPKAFFPSFVFLLFPEVFLAFKHCAVESHFGTCNSFQALVMCRSWHVFSKT